MVSERVSSKGFPRGSSGLASEGASRRLPRWAALVVGLEIDGSDLIGSSDRPNRLAVPGRPIGDQRRRCIGRLSSSGKRSAGRCTAANDGEAHRRRDTVMDLARVWVKRDERHVAKLGEWPASTGKYGRRPAARGGARPCRSPRRRGSGGSLRLGFGRTRFGEHEGSMGMLSPPLIRPGEG